MAAIVGHVANPHTIRDTPSAWIKARECLRERAPHTETAHHASGMQIAFRGRPEQQHVCSDAVSAFVDGRIENLGSLAERFGLAGRGHDARTVADLFAVAGESLFADLIGSYALTVIDHRRARVHLVRDRYGGRPLFMARTNEGIAWASECRMLLPLLAARRFDPEGLAESMYYKWLVGDRTLFDGIEQVVMASASIISTDEVRAEPQRYWRPEFAPDAPQAPFSDWVERTDAALHAYLDRTVPPGSRVAVLLSGGTDSSLMARYVAQHTENCVLVTPTWRDFDDPEIPRARAYAQLIGKEHRVHEYDQALVADLFPQVISRLEQPSRNFHALTLSALMPQLQEFDGVVYSEAADTMFGPFGILYLRNFARKWELFRPYSRALDGLAGLLPQRAKVRDFRRVMRESPADVVRKSGVLPHPKFFVDRLRALGLRDEPNATLRRLFLRDDLDVAEGFQAFAIATDIACHLECTDRLGEPFGVDFLVPFLSPEIVDLALRLPTEYKTDARGTKPILKALARRWFPEELVYARKLGFPTPTDRWLTKELAPRVAALRHSPIAALIGDSVVAALDPRQHEEAIWILISLNECIAQFGIDVSSFQSLVRG